MHFVAPSGHWDRDEEDLPRIVITCFDKCGEEMSMHLSIKANLFQYCVLGI